MKKQAPSWNKIHDDLPKLGVDIAFMVNGPNLKTARYNNYEKIYYCSPPFGLYKPKTEEEEVKVTGITVFDCFDKSPYYKQGCYLDSSKLIKPQDDAFGKTAKRSNGNKASYSNTNYLRTN